MRISCSSGFCFSPSMFAKKHYLTIEFRVQYKNPNFVACFIINGVKRLTKNKSDYQCERSQIYLVPLNYDIELYFASDKLSTPAYKIIE